MCPDGQRRTLTLEDPSRPTCQRGCCLWLCVLVVTKKDKESALWLGALTISFVGPWPRGPFFCAFLHLPEPGNICALTWLDRNSGGRVARTLGWSAVCTSMRHRALPLSSDSLSILAHSSSSTWPHCSSPPGTTCRGACAAMVARATTHEHAKQRPPWIMVSLGE